MLSTVFGLPTHPLVVHFVVFFIPVTVLTALVVSLWPEARRRFALWALGAATIAVLAVPLATETGEHLEARVPHSKLVEEHAELADALLPLMAALWVGLALVVAVRWYAGRATEARWTGFAMAGAIVITVVASLATGVQVVRIGHSGSKAVWHEVGSESGAGQAP
ncbi:hypothetical protein J4573_40640 [Actinomadura barringtoniae]|uniref:DUF2231 domain-containing protein n=1 Tax=Actinomadura barringtoniae TaxID=1427535 RepID=A0A939T7U0_9ACTN|nr:DUF2231 domain-containing protein [Actinomadura barringtoniae]MBO2453458.1 hypothetical protein [Actinomadura barringtoniae]